MSYYILPKKNTEFELHIKYTDEISPFVSHSLCFFLQEWRKHLYILSEEEKTKDSYFEILKNPFSFVYCKVPYSHYSVSKLKPFSTTFYIFMEIIQMFSLLDIFEKRVVQTLHYGNNSVSVIECLDMLREDQKDFHSYYEDIFEDKNSEKCMNKIDILTYEMKSEDYLDTRSYVEWILYVFIHIMCNQAENGIAIIKVHELFLKPILDVLYILTSMYEKIYILKPNNTDMCESERFIICKHFIVNEERYKQYINECNQVFLRDESDIMIVSSILKMELPCLFINKIEESNIIIGNQQLEFIQQLISLFKSKNKEEKCELWKKNNIQKCIKWCEKFKIPYNKFTDRVNIFLQISSASASTSALSLSIMESNREMELLDLSI
jgi:hypothetical protein